MDSLSIRDILIADLFNAELRRMKESLPAPGTPADQLSASERAAVLFFSRAPREYVSTERDGFISMGWRPAHPTVITDRGDGGYVVNVLEPPKPPSCDC